MKKFGFTLAEVLITLAIIGVVAAMTIPTLVQNYKQKQMIVALQKSYALFKNVFELSKVDHGDFSSWQWTHIDYESRTQHFWETYLLPYLKVAKTCFPISEDCYPYTEARMLNGVYNLHTVTNDGIVVLNDGTTIWSWSSNDLYNPHIRINIDINGSKAPNVVGKDIFYFFFTTSPAQVSIGSVNENEEYLASNSFKYVYGFSIFGEGSGMTVEEALDPNVKFRQELDISSVEDFACYDGTQRGNWGILCGYAIKQNGWKIPDGYPKL